MAHCAPWRRARLRPTRVIYPRSWFLDRVSTLPVDFRANLSDPELLLKRSCSSWRGFGWSGTSVFSRANAVSLTLAIVLTSVGHVDAEKNKVLAVERAAPSRHNGSSNLFIEDCEPT